MELVIITGMSGAGKSLTMRALEDMGFFCIDNLPPQFLPKISELAFASMSKITKVASVIDIRGGDLFLEFYNVLREMKEKNIEFKIIFLDASNEVLIKRYKESRRKHPLMTENEGRIIEAIEQERKILEDIKMMADFIIDTSNYSPKELKEKLMNIFLENNLDMHIYINVMSFGFKYGIPLDSDIVIDVRFLPNPFYIDHLKNKTGYEKEVENYVLSWEVTKEFLDKFSDLVKFLIPNYIEEGKTQLVIAIGCTGGKHRSVVIANQIHQYIQKIGYKASVYHRDIEKDNKG